MGQEHYGKGVDMQLGPVAGPLGRAPAGGRNWEGFSPDPYLTGLMFAESIKGIQSAGVMTSAKHFIAYEQEHFRQSQEAKNWGFNVTESVSANLDDVTLHELYLWPFADGIRAGATTVMCSYNQVNGSQACQNSYILNHILKNELGFQVSLDKLHRDLEQSSKRIMQAVEMFLATFSLTSKFTEGVTPHPYLYRYTIVGRAGG